MGTFSINPTFATRRALFRLSSLTLNTQWFLITLRPLGCSTRSYTPRLLRVSSSLMQACLHSSRRSLGNCRMSWYVHSLGDVSLAIGEMALEMRKWERAKTPPSQHSLATRCLPLVLSWGRSYPPRMAGFSNYFLPVFQTSDSSFNFHRVLVTIDVPWFDGNLLYVDRSSRGRLQQLGVSRNNRSRSGSFCRGRGGRLGRCGRFWRSGARLLSHELVLPVLWGDNPSGSRLFLIIPWKGALAGIVFMTMTGWWHRGLQPGVHTQLSHRALWKQRLIKDGLSSREDDVVWTAHENPSFTSWM